jgi:hypothetical protein
MLGIASLKACLVSHPPSRSDISIKEIWLLSERASQSSRPQAALEAGATREEVLFVLKGGQFR